MALRMLFREVIRLLYLDGLADLFREGIRLLYLDGLADVTQGTRSGYCTLVALQMLSREHDQATVL